MLEIFSSGEVYNMKELEKIGTKKGVLSQAIPGTLQQIRYLASCRVSDNLFDASEGLRHTILLV